MNSGAWAIRTGMQNTNGLPLQFADITMYCCGGSSRSVQGSRDVIFISHEIDSSVWIWPTASSEAMRTIMGLLQWSKQLVSDNELHLDEELLRWSYLLRAKQRSWIAFDGTLRLQKLKDTFDTTYREVSTLPGFSIAAETDGPNSGFLGGMFRKVVGRHHSNTSYC